MNNVHSENKSLYNNNSLVKQFGHRANLRLKCEVKPLKTKEFLKLSECKILTKKLVNENRQCSRQFIKLKYSNKSYSDTNMKRIQPAEGGNVVEDVKPQCRYVLIYNPFLSEVLKPAEIVL